MITKAIVQGSPFSIVVFLLCLLVPKCHLRILQGPKSVGGPHMQLLSESRKKVKDIQIETLTAAGARYF